MLCSHTLESFNKALWLYLRFSFFSYALKLLVLYIIARKPSYKEPSVQSFGQLVVLGFDIAVFIPAPYQRCRLQRPSKEI